MSRRQQSEMVIGEDAFLDTVANLVGILIILVVIVSTGTRTAAQLITEEQLQAAEKKLDQPVSTATNIEKDLARQQEQLAEHTLEVAYRSAERNTILEKLLVAKQQIEEEKSSLTVGQQEDVQNQQLLSEMERQLAELLQQQGDNQSKDKPPIVLQHLPTPMAKTVFGKELHLMILDGLVTVIPWDRLVMTLKDEARNAAARSTRRDRIAEQLGPIEGFNMDYVMVSKRGLVSNGTSTAMAQMIELDKFELEPTSDIIREPLDMALGGNGRLRIELAGYNPRETTVTAWVYPNSFETFRQLKERLFHEGYMTAARPMPDGMRIGASPRGSQSSAQ
jgi:hypothetical protein